MDTHTPASQWQHQPENIVDLLRTAPPCKSFHLKVKALGLSVELEKKILCANAILNTKKNALANLRLSREDETELAAEVLLHRHTFTRQVFQEQIFRQTALTIIQNIYLFQHRKIFFHTNEISHEQERQEALLLFSSPTNTTTIPLAKTFQHLIVARVWDRILRQADDGLLKSQPFLQLYKVVDRLNTLRNIYMLLTTGLVRKITQKTNSIYRQSITREDAHQIGCFGIARAAYRYHPSSAVRFSTYASHWILKEIQRHALEGRLIKISSNLVEQMSHAARNRHQEQERSTFHQLGNATVQLAFRPLEQQDSTAVSPAAHLEEKEFHKDMLKAIDTVLSEKMGDVIKRRYGLGLYLGNKQSAVEISKAYGVTRGSIYQLEQSAMKKLKKHLALKWH